MAQATDAAQLLCLKTEEALLNIVDGQIAPSQVEVQTFGALKAIQDSMSSGIRNLENIVNGPTRPTQGNDREVTIEYLKPDCSAATECSDVDFDDCPTDTDAIETYGYDRFSIDSCTTAKFVIDYRYYTGNCIPLAKDLRDKGFAAVRKMMKAENEAAITWLYNNVGNYFAQNGQTPVNSQTSPSAVNVLNASMEPQPLGFFKVESQYEDMGVAERGTYFVSGSNLWKAYMYADRNGIFSQGQDDGINPSTVTVPNAYYDKRVDPVITASGGGSSNYAVSFVPGSVANVPWFEFDNDEASTSSDGLKMWNPVQARGRRVKMKMDVGTAFGFGMPYIVDADIFYDDCKDKVIFQFRRYFDFWKIPNDAFVEACDQQHNYMLLWTIDTGALNEAYFADIVA